VSVGEWLCLDCAEPHLPTAPEVEPPVEPDRPDPFTRPLDRLLTGLRLHCGPDPYVTRGVGVWWARCPLHPDAGYSLLVTEQEEGREVELCCRVGCPPSVIRGLLVPDPEREAIAAARAAAIVWAQMWSRRRAS
jgi:hypothetical protein